MKCRCGHEGDGPHPCHRCINKGGEVRTGQSRMVAYPTSLSGQQPKVGVYETFACDECLADYRESVKRLERNESARRGE